MANNQREIKFSSFRPQKYYLSSYSITPDPENQTEVEDLKKIVEGGSYSKRELAQMASQEPRFEQNHYVVIFNRRRSKLQRRIETQLQEMGHKLQTPLRVNPKRLIPIRQSQ